MTDGGTLQPARDGDARYDRRDPDLTKFQLRILAILADEARYGLAIKDALEAYYEEEVFHGRLYPNADQLVEEGYVEKSALDKRTNLYEITAEGRAVLEDELEWVAFKAGYELERSQEGGRDA
jgi:DNA-binding PadR family transcriptional regulator